MSIDDIEANIDRGRAVLKATTSTMKALDRSAAVVQDAISARRDISSAVELWRVDGKQNALAIDSIQRRQEEIRAWNPLANSTSSPGADWAKAIDTVASSNPMGLAVTTAVTLVDDYLERRVHKQGYEQLSRSLDGGLRSIDQTLGSGLGRLDRTLGKGLKRLDRTLGRGLAELSSVLGRGMTELNRTMEAGFQQLSADFSWGISELLWRADQQNATLVEIRDVLTRPLDVQSRELRNRGIRLYNHNLLPEARAELLDAMAKNRVDYVVAHYLGNIALREQDYVAAAEWFYKSARWSRPEEPHYTAVALMHQALAIVLGGTDEDTDNCHKAIACLDDALSLDPTNIEAAFQRAQYLARVGDSAEAITALEEVIDHDGLYLVRVLMERDFQGMADNIADLVYWLTKSYSHTIEKQLRQLAPFLRQVSEGIKVDGTNTMINPYADNQDVEAFVQAVTLATSLFALGDFYSVQQAEVILLSLRSPERRRARNRYLWIESSDGAGYSIGRGAYGSYHDVTYTFFGVGGNFV